MTSPENENIVELPGASFFPLAYGNEEETGMIDDTYGQMDEPYLLTEHLRKYVPQELLSTAMGRELFLKNGTKFYPGGDGSTRQPLNPERATPECSNPAQLNLHMRASELLLTNTVSNYLVEMSNKYGGTFNSRIQRRVVDSNESRKACHDSFGISDHSSLSPLENLPNSVLAHLASRSFITGAGYVHKNGLSYAQKIGGLTNVNGYGYFGSMYRITSADGTRRIEVRCSDINISDWAATVRIGSTALFLAIAQTPLGSKLQTVEHFNAIGQANKMNRLKLNPDGSIESNRQQLLAVDIQQRAAEMAIDELPKHVDYMPASLLKIAREIQTYCDDYRKVLAGQESVELLANRADWAAKAMIILRGISKDEKNGIKRTLIDFKSQAADMRYDYIGLSATDGVLNVMRRGTGYQMRSRGMFKGQKITDYEVRSAYDNPPSGTRAVLRAELLSKYQVEDCNWQSVIIRDGEAKHAFRFPHVLETGLSAKDRERLAEIKRIA